MTLDIETEREVQFLEVSKEELSRHGWKLCRRRDGHVFTVMVIQGTNLERAFSEGRGIYARHQLKSAQGDLLPVSHLDLLYKGKLQEQEIMSTAYDPSIGHYDFVVLKRTTNQSTIE